MSEIALTPGAPRAKREGCLCPAIDNGHGTGCGYLDDNGQSTFWIREDCPLHGSIKRAAAPRGEEVREAAFTRNDAMTLIGHAEYLRRVHCEQDMPRFFDGLARRLLAALAARGERGE